MDNIDTFDDITDASAYYDTPLGRECTRRFGELLLAIHQLMCDVCPIDMNTLLSDNVHDKDNSYSYYAAGLTLQIGRSFVVCTSPLSVEIMRDIAPYTALLFILHTHNMSGLMIRNTCNYVREGINGNISSKVLQWASKVHTSVVLPNIPVMMIVNGGIHFDAGFFGNNREKLRGTESARPPWKIY